MGWTKAPKDEKLCVVVTRTYEIGHDDDDEDHDEETEEQPQQQVPEEELQLTGWRAWLAWPFVPRYPDHFVTSSQQDVSGSSWRDVSLVGSIELVLLPHQ